MSLISTFKLSSLDEESCITHYGYFGLPELYDLESGLVPYIGELQGGGHLLVLGQNNLVLQECTVTGNIRTWYTHYPDANFGPINSSAFVIDALVNDVDSVTDKTTIEARCFGREGRVFLIKTEENHLPIFFTPTHIPQSWTYKKPVTITDATLSTVKWYTPSGIREIAAISGTVNQKSPATKVAAT